MKYSLDIIWKTIKTPFSQAGEFRRNPQLSWKVILVFCVLGIIATLTLGYFTYYQAVTENGQEIATSPRSALRSVDVKAVLATYQQKKESFNAFLVNEPVFPSPGKGGVISSKEEKTVSPPSATTSLELAP